MIYLDNGATTLQKPPRVAEAMEWAITHCASPGRGGHPAAAEAERAVFRCRELAAELFDTEAERVVFTMNATHALNLAIKTLVPPGGRVAVSGFEHNAVTRPLHALRAEVRVAGRRPFAPADTMRDFERLVTGGLDAVICTHVSNVFGCRMPIESLAELCHSRGVPLIVDAAQSAGILPLSMRRLGAAFIAMPGHKGLYGPQGTGILLCGRGVKPLLEGGTGSRSRDQTMPGYLPDAAESGTHNVPGICGLAEGLRFVLARGTDAILAHERALLSTTTAALEGAAGIHLYTGPGQTGVLSLTVDGLDCETAAARLAEQGVAVRAGLHCAPLAHESAGTLEIGTIRLSFSAFNTEEEAAAAAAILRRVQK